ncbi:YigZ family protein [Coprothermobacteraceae bacterium]|nr:YigZ family protein [Coprothermobacteraceae bacterium]
MPRSVKGQFTFRQVIDRSEFIAYVAAVFSEADVRSFVHRIKSEHKQASHHVWAYKMGSSSYYTDAGEPPGSAGLPVMNAIRAQDVDYVCVIVVRYFGGVLLGVKGLINAYHSTAAKVLELAEKGEVIKESKVQLVLGYAAHGRLFDKLSAHIRDMSQDFGENVLVTGWLSQDSLSTIGRWCSDEGVELQVLDEDRWAVR